MWFGYLIAELFSNAALHKLETFKDEHKDEHKRIFKHRYIQ